LGVGARRSLDPQPRGWRVKPTLTLGLGRRSRRRLEAQRLLLLAEQERELAVHAELLQAVGAAGASAEGV